MATTGNGDGLTLKLADFYAALDYESLPPYVIDRAKYFCLDYLAVAIRGSITPSSESMQRVVKGLSPNGESVIMGTSLAATPEYAALANGTAAHSLGDGRRQQRRIAASRGGCLPGRLRVWGPGAG